MPSRINIDASSVRGLADKLKGANQQLQVGWFEGAKYTDSTPVAQVAAWNEFGTKTAPARPFMRPASDDNRAKWVQAYMATARKWLRDGGDYNSVLTTLGLVVQGDVRGKITGNHKPLSPVTLALRRLKNDNVPIGKRTVGMVAGAIAAGHTGPGQLGQPFANTTPLNETGIMLATLTFEVVNNE